MKPLDHHIVIGLRIAAGFLIVLLLMIGLTAVGLRHIAEANERLRGIVENNNIKTEMATAMQRALRERALSMHAISVLDDPFDQDREVMRFNSVGAEYTAARQRLEAMPLTGEERRVLDDIRALTRAAQPEVQAVVDLALQGNKHVHLEKMRNEAMPKQRLIAEKVQALIALQQRQTTDAMHKAEDSYLQVRRLMVLLSVATVLLGFGIAWYVSRRVACQARQLEEQALYDRLTCLPNRSLLQDRLAQEIAHSRRARTAFCVLLMDLDGFKAVNDTLGHAAGDRLLCEVSQRLKGAVRRGDTVARLGGDEFVIVLHDLDLQRVRPVAQKILACLDRPVEIDGQIIDIGASAGIAVFPDHAQDDGTLLRQADIAMYVAKRAGQRLALYSPEQEQLTRSDLSLKSDLREAAESGQLKLHYQPKIDHRSRRVVGVEALLRWEHPQRGFLPPDRFIPLAEQAGLITQLTHWVLRAALSQMAEFKARGHPLAVAVNLSARDLHDPSLPSYIEAVLQETGMPPERLTLELTESTVMSNPGDALKVLTELDRMGITLAIDDFGTGYSSLAYLKRLPVDEIKIDKSFVADMLSNDNDAVIVKSTIDLGHNLGLRIIAEGVEDQATFDALAALGCDAAQGYLMGRPMPAEELLAWLETSPWGLGRQAVPLPQSIPALAGA